MSATTRSRLGDAPTSQPSSGSPDKVRSFNLKSSIHGELRDSFVQGLKSMFESFVTQPDFRQHYERNLALRPYRPWHRVGNSMRLALGKPITLTVMYPDGQRRTHIVEPKISDDAFRSTMCHAQEAAEDSDEFVAPDHTTVFLTRKQSDDLADYVRRK